MSDPVADAMDIGDGLSESEREDESEQIPPISFSILAYVCICVYVYVCVYMYMRVCVCVYVYMCMCVCVYVCTCVCVYVYVSSRSIGEIECSFLSFCLNLKTMQFNILFCFFCIIICLNS